MLKQNGNDGHREAENVKHTMQIIVLETFCELFIAMAGERWFCATLISISLITMRWALQNFRFISLLKKFNTCGRY